MSINYAKYKKLKRIEEHNLARNIYNSPQNLAATTYHERKKTLIILYCMFIIPGVIYHIFVWNKLDNIIVEKYDNIVALLWRRSSNRDQIIGTPNIVSSHNELKLPEDEYTNEQLIEVISAIFSKNESMTTSLRPFNNVDNSLHKSIKNYGLEEHFFDFEAGDHSKSEKDKFEKIIHKEDHTSSTTKLLFTYSKTVFDVSNFITSTRMIIKNDEKDDSYEYIQHENVAGLSLTSSTTIVDFVDLIIVSKTWKSQAVPKGYRDITDQFDSSLKSKAKVYSSLEDTSDLKDWLSDDLAKKLAKITNSMTPYIIKVCENSELTVFWEEVDKTLRPLSEGDLVRFATEHKYGVRTLSKEVFYIKQMYDLLDLFYEGGLI